jgi:hypothetical protein
MRLEVTRALKRPRTVTVRVEALHDFFIEKPIPSLRSLGPAIRGFASSPCPPSCRSISCPILCVCGRDKDREMLTGKEYDML